MNKDSEKIIKFGPFAYIKLFDVCGYVDSSAHHFIKIGNTTCEYSKLFWRFFYTKQK